MEYDYEGVTEIRHDKDEARLEIVAKGKRVVVEGIRHLYLKSIPFMDDEGVAHLNNGRVSLKGDEAAAGEG